MATLSNFLSSNAVQMAFTLTAGIIVYLALFFVPRHQIFSNSSDQARIVTEKFFLLMLEILGIVLLIIITFSFLFDLFETYQYSSFYKRNFGPFGDGYAFAYLFLLNIGLFSEKKRLVVISAILSILTGGKLALIAFAISIVFFKLFTSKKSPKINAKHYLLIPLVIYILLLSASNFLISKRIKENTQNFMYSVTGYANDLEGRDACIYVSKCFDTQVANAVKQRVITSIAGIWMTSQGGFGGLEYPGTPEKFANFMMHQNPYGINEYFNLNWNFWASAGAVQHPYLNIGSGYGFSGLLAIIFLFFGTGFQGIKLLLVKHQDLDCGHGLIVFFILLVFLNQTQQWIQSASILLFLSGYCMAHIWKVELLRRIKKND